MEMANRNKKSVANRFIQDRRRRARGCLCNLIDKRRRVFLTNFPTVRVLELLRSPDVDSLTPSAPPHPKKKKRPALIYARGHGYRRVSRGRRTPIPPPYVLRPSVLGRVAAIEETSPRSVLPRSRCLQRGAGPGSPTRATQLAFGIARRAVRRRTCFGLGLPSSTFTSIGNRTGDESLPTCWSASARAPRKPAEPPPARRAAHPFLCPQSRSRPIIPKKMRGWPVG